MNFAKNKEQELLYDEVVSFAQANLNEGVERRDRDQSFDRGLWGKCGQSGMIGFAIPKEYGGRGLDAIDTMAALEALGYGCRDNGLSFAIGAHLLACAVPIWKYGSDRQKSYYLPKMCDGSWVATNAITETKSGSDVFSMQMEARRIEKGYSINGEKKYCSNAPVADLALIYAISNLEKRALGGVSGFILEKEKGQFESGGKIEKMGLRSCLMGNLKLSNTSVSEENVLGKAGGGTVQFTYSMVWERIGLSAIHVGTMKRLLEDAVLFSKERRVFGQTINNYQAISHILANSKVQLEAARLLVYKAAWQLKENRKVRTAASEAKLFVSEMYKQQTMQLLQIYGALGYTNNSDIERSVRDATSATLYSGTSEIQRNLIARSL